MKHRYHALTDTKDLVFLGWFDSKPIHLIGRDISMQDDRLPLWSEPKIRMVLDDDDLYRFTRQAKECLSTS